ncbi:F-box only protein 4 isoform X3 [Scomber japonicus]|uniref:F-box only protein 4 isoform X3 n=1 Tax=Scomber japonicus TaxID=13676 RepID=UPI002306B69E|nr:F-box only protein 4 isoform X3 [Scomber japonicus]
MDEEESQPSYLDSLPVDIHFLIMTFLSPADICRLGATSQYWRAMVRDPLLWRFFLLRDMPYWPSIDHLTMPQLELLDAPLVSENAILDDTEEEGDQTIESKLDYMAEYLKGCPSCRQKWLPSRPTYKVVTSFLQSLVPSSEPRYAMFGPGMEKLDVSLVTRLMRAPDVLPVSGTPHRQINGIGSGISYMFKNQHKFNILALYSTNRAERERARVEQQSISNKLFTFEGSDDSGYPVYSPAPHVQQVCQVVDGFIYVANAEPGRGEGLCWCCRVSPGKKLKLSAPPAYKQVPAETGPGVELPALTWQRDLVCPIWLIPGWCKTQWQNPCREFWMAFLGC